MYSLLSISDLDLKSIKKSDKRQGFVYLVKLSQCQLTQPNKTLAEIFSINSRNLLPIHDFNVPHKVIKYFFLKKVLR